MFDSISLFLENGANLLWFLIGLPLVCGLAVWLFRKNHLARLILVVVSAAVNLVFALSLYLSDGFYIILPFAGNGLDFAFNIYEFASMFLVFVAVAFFLVCLYGVVFLKNARYAGRFILYMYISLAMINGAIMSDNLGLMLFFWEGLLCTLFGILLINNEHQPKAAVKALVLSGTADLLLMLGIIITVYQAGTPYMILINRIPLTGPAAIGFVCMMLGAVGKAGSMPFHSWIPNAADDAPTPFMAAFPGSLEKFLGIYLTARIAMDLFDFRPESGLSIAVMTLGTITIVFAVAMALIQKDMKRLLSYHAISQVGYMILGIGTALPIGIIGGIFHMLNHVAYKSCLFMTAGSIEQQTGTTDLRKIGGLRKVMPVTMVCFLISALAISGVPPFNGFFSKELIFDAALEIHPVFYIGALLGAFLTAVSFLKLGRAAFGGPAKFLPEKKNVRESGFGMLLPMGILAAVCILFGVANTLPLDGIIGPALGYTESFSGWPHSILLVAISVLVLLLAVGDHAYGKRKSGSAINAADHIHYAPVLKHIYHAAEKQWFDPYEWISHAVSGYSAVCVWIERGVSWFYDVGVVRFTKGAGSLLSRFSNGSLARYLVVSLAGVAGIVMIFLAILL